MPPIRRLRSHSLPDLRGMSLPQLPKEIVEKVFSLVTDGKTVLALELCSRQFGQIVGDVFRKNVEEVTLKTIDFTSIDRSIKCWPFFDLCAANMRSLGDPEGAKRRFDFSPNSIKLSKLMRQIWTESKRLKRLEFHLSLKPERMHYFEDILEIMENPRPIDSLVVAFGHMNRWTPDTPNNCSQLTQLIRKMENLQDLEIRWYEILSSDPHPLHNSVVWAVSEIPTLRVVSLKVSGILQQWSCISLDFESKSVNIWRSPGYDHNLHDNFAVLVRFMHSGIIHKSRDAK